MADAWNTAEVVPVGIVTLAGETRAELPLDNVIRAPPAGADWDSVTLQAVELPLGTKLGAQEREETTADASSAMFSETCALLVLAVIVTVLLLETALAVAENAALKAGPAMVTLAGTLTVVELLARAIVVPEGGAGLFSVTVQLALPGPVRVVGVQVSTDTCGGGCRLMETVCWVLLARAVMTVV